MEYWIEAGSMVDVSTGTDPTEKYPALQTQSLTSSEAPGEVVSEGQTTHVLTEVAPSTVEYVPGPQAVILNPPLQ